MEKDEKHRYTKLLFDIGVVASSHGLCQKSDIVMRALMALDAQKEEAVIGVGYNLIAWGKADKAVELFQEKTKVLKQVSIMYEAMIGLALFASKRYGEAERLLMLVKDKAETDSVAAGFADNLLKELKMVDVS